LCRIDWVTVSGFSIRNVDNDRWKGIGVVIRPPLNQRLRLSKSLTHGRTILRHSIEPYRKLHFLLYYPAYAIVYFLSALFKASGILGYVADRYQIASCQRT